MGQVRALHRDMTVSAKDMATVMTKGRPLRFHDSRKTEEARPNAAAWHMLTSARPADRMTQKRYTDSR